MFGERQIEVVESRPVQRKGKQPAAQTAPIPLPFADALNSMEQQLRVQRYSWNTVKTYKNFLAQLLAFYSKRDPKELGKKIAYASC